MGRAVVSSRVICFKCRSASCACVSQWNAFPAEWRITPARSELAWALAWLGGACAAGTALGAALAFLMS
jgi:hypothetical protein